MHTETETTVKLPKREYNSTQTKFLSQMDYFSLAGHIFASFPTIHLTINNVREFLGLPNKIMINRSAGSGSTAYIGPKSSVRPDKSDS